MSKPPRFVLILEQIIEGEIIKDALHQYYRPVLPDIPHCLFNGIKPAPGGKSNFSGLLFEPANAPIVRSSADKSVRRGICIINWKPNPSGEIITLIS